MKKSEAINWRRKIEGAASYQPDDVAVESVDLYPLWRAGIAVNIGERYRYNEILYKVIQAHTTQEDWTPDVAVSLFVEVSVKEWPEWKQPTGASDAYMAGDKVKHNEKHWVSSVDNNVWEPGVYGWDEQSKK